MTPGECAEALAVLSEEIRSWSSSQPGLPGLVRMLADYVTLGDECAAQLAEQVAALTAEVARLKADAVTVAEPAARPARRSPETKETP